MTDEVTCVSHPQLRLTREADDRIRLEAGSLSGVLVGSDTGWRVEGFGELDGHTLEPGDDGIVLRGDGGRREMAHAAGESGCRDVVLDDGRMFRIRGRELRGWLVPGAYFVASGGDGSWAIDATPAGCGIVDPGQLWLLLAIEILGVFEQ